MSFRKYNKVVEENTVTSHGGELYWSALRGRDPDLNQATDALQSKIRLLRMTERPNRPRSDRLLEPDPASGKAEKSSLVPVQASGKTYAMPGSPAPADAGLDILVVLLKPMAVGRAALPLDGLCLLPRGG